MFNNTSSKYRAVNEPENEFVTVHMPHNVWQMVMGFTKSCQYEIAGFGYVDQLADGSLTITEAFILKQSVTNASVDTDAEVIALHMTEMVRKGEDPGRMRLQWHSHVDMRAYFSAIDTGQIARYDCPWMVSLVVNKRGEYDIRLDMYKPFRVQIPARLVFDEVIDDSIQVLCDAEIADKVSVARPASFSSGLYSYEESELYSLDLNIPTSHRSRGGGKRAKLKR
ncbi:MAG: Mov34/MPN/PAD-1 family protein [Candidatus Nomurabacteria bacterium]|jgi:proteasome lid subunit RPN8/RPN11|nr:Mov34/MPN/PAD-1 family protein [Candidatus Nomurabacteria bacterium]